MDINEFFKTEIDSRGVATLTMSRAEKHNAFDDNFILQLTHNFSSFAENPKIRVVVLAAEGKSFSAGADLNWMRRMAAYNYEDNVKDARALADMLHTLNSLPQPTIAKVQGAAFGGAVGLVSCCDIAVATKAAKFCLSEVKLGLIPATISPYVVAAIGKRAARRYFQTAETFSAEVGERLGLVSEIVDESNLSEVVEKYISLLLNNGPKAMSEAKKLVMDVSDKPIDEALREQTSQRIASIRVSEEGQEGLNAFLEKRKPQWLGD